MVKCKPEVVKVPPDDIDAAARREAPPRSTFGHARVLHVKSCCAMLAWAGCTRRNQKRQGKREVLIAANALEKVSSEP